MGDQVDARTWANRGLFVALALALVFGDLVPLDQRPAQWASPDLLLVCACLWVARRPDYLPLPVLAVIFFATDLLFQRPPGLWAALVVLLTETIRSRENDLRTMSFLSEWGMVAVGLTAITLANRLVLALVMTPQAPLGMTMVQLVATIAAYPVIAALAYFVFGISRLPPDTLRSTRVRR